jgi:hypothetical protein
MLDKLKGFKTKIFGIVMIALGVGKMLTEIPELESIAILGFTEASALITTGLGIIFIRDAIK